MDSLAIKVAARYGRVVLADSIGNIPEMLSRWEWLLTRWEDVERRLPLIREAEAMIQPQHGVSEEDWVRRPEIAPYEALYRKHIYEYVVAPSSFSRILHQTGANMLFLAILQQYELPPAIRKKVELAARVADKKKRDFKKPTALDGFEKLMAEMRGYVEIAKVALEQGRMRGQTETHLKAGPFEIVNAGGFEEDRMQECAAVVEKAARLIEAKGQGRVCYGQVLMSNTLSKSSTAAFYLVGKDEMFIRANLKDSNENVVRYVIHELGHRLEFMFLNATQKKQMARMHWVRKHGEERDMSALEDEVRKDPERCPKPGDIFESSSGRTLEVTHFLYNEILLKEAGSDRPGGWKISLRGWIQAKGYDKHLQKKPRFVTGYAAKNPSENFAEMFSFYCLDKLSTEDTAEVQELLRG